MQPNQVIVTFRFTDGKSQTHVFRAGTVITQPNEVGVSTEGIDYVSGRKIVAFTPWAQLRNFTIDSPHIEIRADQDGVPFVVKHDPETHEGDAHE